MPLTAEDRAAIQELSTRYCHLVDYGDIDGLLELFTEDAYFESPLKSWAVHRARLPHMYLRTIGQEQLRFFFSSPGEATDEHGSFAAREAIEDDNVGFLHIPTAHSIVQSDAESATMVCYLTFHYLEDPPQLMAYGRYVDRVTKAGGEWKIADRVVAIEWDGRIDEPATSTDKRPRYSEYPWPLPDAADTSLSAADHTEILELAARYCHTVDYRDWDGLSKIFTDDVHFGTHLNSWSVHLERLPGLRLALVGHDEIRGFFEGPPGENDESVRLQQRAAVQEGNVSNLHIPTVQSIEVDGDRATMLCNFTFHYLEDPPRMTAYGRYRDRLKKIDGQWKFAHRFIDIEWDGREVI